MTLRVLLIIFCIAASLRAQESESTSGDHFPEAEFVASASFRSASYVQPLWKGLRLESDYFGADENDVGYTGGSWEFHWRRLRFTPGLGVAFGGNGFRTMPALSFRWAFEKGWIISEGLVVQGFGNTPRVPEDTSEARAEGSVRPTITDGDHLSVRWRRLMVGGTWERIQFREIEWKGGGRVAVRLFPHLSGVISFLGPGAEIRGGLILHPREEDKTSDHAVHE